MKIVRHHTLLLGMALASLPLAAQTQGPFLNWGGQVSAPVPSGSNLRGVTAHLARMPEAGFYRFSEPFVDGDSASWVPMHSHNEPCVRALRYDLHANGPRRDK
jgi:hypothetical protein